MGVILWYQVKFTELNVTVSNDVYSGDYLDDAKISVTYGIGQPGSFEIDFKNLPLKVNEAIADRLQSSDAGVEVDIKLGYLDDPGSRKSVLTGRVYSMKGSTHFLPLGLQLKGYETAAYALLTTYDAKTGLAQITITEDDPTPSVVVERVLHPAGMKPAGKVTPEKWSNSDGNQPGAPKSIHREAPNAFGLLNNLAKSLGAEVLVQDGSAQFGVAVVDPPETGFPTSPPNPSAVLTLLTAENVLIRTRDLEAARLAVFKPLVVAAGVPRPQRLITELADQSAVKCFEFTVLGSATFRAGQLVIASVGGYENPFKPFRLLQVTHSFGAHGYVCEGRAADFDAGGNNRGMTELARHATAPALAELIVDTIKEVQAKNSSVDVGRVKAVKTVDRVADLYYRQESDPGVSTPCVDLDVKAGDFLSGKPLAAPFAWHKVGLTVPVYEGMRALLNQSRNSRNNAVVAGFLWANNSPKMQRPKSHDGDWWLCLPTEVSGDPKLPTGKGVNDLVSADGRRVIEAVGLKVVVGKDSCSDVGERPTEGDPGVLLISHTSGTTIQIDTDGNVTVDAKGKSVVLKSDDVTLTVGDTVSIS